MRRNVASQVVCAQMNSRTDGSPLTTGVTVVISKDGGTQGASAGTTSHLGNGCWAYFPTSGETDANQIAFTFTHSTGVHQTVNVYTLAYVYQAKVGFIDDNAGAKDIYTVVWYKDGAPLLSGLTTPEIEVLKETDGTALIATASMTQIGSTGMYKYEASTTERAVDGAHYLVRAKATIDGANRNWYQWVGRDSA